MSVHSSDYERGGLPGVVPYASSASVEPGLFPDFRDLLILVLAVVTAIAGLWEYKRSMKPMSEPSLPICRLPPAPHCAFSEARKNPTTGELPRDYSINCPHWQRWWPNPQQEVGQICVP